MPIYVYRCGQCGCEQEVLQKISAAPLSQCPQCHSDSFSKQVTAAGFQLKGSGWYQTDFKGGKPAETAAKPKADDVPPCQGGTGSCACN